VRAAGRKDGRKNRVFSTTGFSPILLAVEKRPPIRVVLVEDNDVFRQALELMLRTTPDVEVVAAVGDGRTAVVACEGTRPDVVLMDYRLPGLDGVEATIAVREVCEAAVVALTATSDSVELDALLEAGAVTCLTKDSSLREIVAAVREAAGRDEGDLILGGGGRTALG
jgi:DNA-binding NarL/FixJ family response regulator